jgi:hypothetical protein
MPRGSADDSVPVNPLPSTRLLPDASPASPRQRALVLLASIASFLIPALLLIASGRIPERVFSDQRVYHEPAIRQFISQWPRVDLFDYLSATTPGYHLLLAGIVKIVSPVASSAGLGEFAASSALLQLISAAITCVWLGTIAWWLTRLTTPLRALATILPLSCSMYVLQAGAYVLPDNGGWLGVTLMLMLALSPRLSHRHVLLAGLVLMALVFTRQNHLWTASLIVIAAWMSAMPKGRAPWETTWTEDLLYAAPARLTRSLMALVACVPALLVLAWLVSLWGGLTPPRFHTLHQGFNLATPGFVLAVLGLGSIIFAGTLWCPVVEALMHWRRWLLIASIVSIAIALIAPTTYSMEAGRWSGLWNVARRLPALGGYASIVIVPLAVLGGVVLTSCLRRLSMNERVVVLSALAAFSCAQAANAQLWQRYVEPFTLLVLVYLVARVGEAVRTRWWELALPVLAAAAFTAGSLGMPGTIRGQGLFAWPRVTDVPSETPFELPTELPAPSEPSAQADGPSTAR